jgi:fibronectin type 3 domain-containing protein
VITTALLVFGAAVIPAAAAGGGPNLASGKTASASSSTSGYQVSNVNDGNQDSYWESNNNAFPQWAQIDLGSATSVGQVTLKLPASWGARSQTLSVQGSTDGSSFSTLVASAAYSFDPASANTVKISFAAATVRYVRVNVTANTGWPAAQLSEFEVYGATSSSGNLALGRTMTASGSNAPYVPGNAGDGDQSSYWESPSGAFPQWLQVDLGSSVSVNKVVLRLPGSTDWATRTETLAVQGSTNGSSFSDIVASKGYTFDPSSGNTVTISFTATTTRYVRINVTANTGWPAAQLSEFEVYGPSTGDTQAPTAPGSLAYTQPASGKIQLSWSASTDNVGVTGYKIYANNALLTQVSGTTTTYTDSQLDSATVSYYVTAVDAAGNESAASNTVTRKGATGDTQAPTAPANLAYTQPASGQVKLTWTAATDNVGVTGYEVFANDKLVSTVSGSTLTYTDSEPDSATVTYYVRAKDAAGNESPNSNSVTRNGTTTGTGPNLAVGKPITASSSTQTFVATNANDNDVTTYWEGAGGTYPNNLTVQLGANADLSSLVVKLNPSSAWGARTQTIEVDGREQSATGFTQLVAAKSYSFDPNSGNTVTIPVSARVADVRLVFTANSGAGGGQVAELQVIGTPAPNPDLTVTSVTASPSAPVETDPLTLSATVKNAGNAASPASDVNFYLGTAKVGTASVPALAAGDSTTVTASVAAQSAGSYTLGATVDESNKVIEQNDSNNSYTSPTPLVVKQVSSSDLVASPVAWSPSSPSAGKTVTFSVALKNQGTVATSGGSHGVTLTLKDANGSTVTTLTGSYSGTIAAGATTSPITLGTWTAANGKYTVNTAIAVDANEVSVKQGNNTSTLPLYVGRGANMPYDSYEAEDGTLGGGAKVVGPNRTIGDLAGEASGREAVTLDNTGDSVSFTTRASTNTLVLRYSIPDSPSGGGIDSNLDVYVNGTFLKAIDLTSKFAWLYGDETSPNNSPGSGGPRRIYDEANTMLGTTVPAGSVIKLQKDAANTSQYAIDFINTEQVSAVPNPDPASYVQPAGFTQQDVQNALDQVRMDTTGKLVGVYLPAGTYQTSNKFQVYGKAVKVVGAGPWYTRFQAPTTQDNTDTGFSVTSTANGSSFTGFSWWGNYTSRIDGPGKVFDLTDVSDITIDNLWIEHQVCAIWGTHVTGLTATNLRIRDTYADGVNLTNGSQNNLVSNDEARTTGDDSFALFAAQDHNSSDLKNNTFQNLTALTPWRAAGIAIYGGYANTIQNLYVADTLAYSGITISSLNFGYPFEGFGSSPQTVIQNASLVRDGGHFWGSQVFPAIWVFSATQPFQGIRVNDVDITSPTYSGIMFQTDYSGGTALNPITDTIFTDITITGAHKSGDAYDAKSGYGIWANPMPESGQGPAVGSVTFNNLKESDNYQDINNTTSTFTINVNN